MKCYKKVTPFLSIVVFFYLSGCCPQFLYLHPDKPVYSGNYGQEETQISDSLKVVTFNLEYGEKVEQAIIELSGNTPIQHPDILLLQEVDELDCQQIAEALEMNFVYYPTVVHTYGKNFGNAVLTRQPISAKRKVLLPHKNPICGQKRLAAVAMIKVDNRTLNIYSLHLEVNSLDIDKRLEQAEAVAAQVTDSIDYAIIGGDFNSLIGHTVENLDKIYRKSSMRRVTGSVDFSYQSGPFGIIKLNLDHIFSKGFRVIDADSYKQSEASDHFPVWAILKFEDD